ncbi:MAG: hypothetical protein WDO71_22565 [Bacteroidota bacterium]
MEKDKKNLKNKSGLKSDSEKIEEPTRLPKQSKLSIAKLLEVWLPIIISFIGIAISLYQFKRTVKDSQMEREIRIKESEPMLAIQKSAFSYDTTNYVFVPVVTNIGKREARNVSMKCLVLYGDENCENLRYVDSVNFPSYNPIVPGESVDFVSGRFSIDSPLQKYFIIKITSTDYLASDIAKMLKLDEFRKEITQDYFFIERHPDHKSKIIYSPRAFALEKKYVEKLKGIAIVKKISH